MLIAMAASQLVFADDTRDEGREELNTSFQESDNGSEKISLSTSWSVLGPFPAGMREHQTGALPAVALHNLSALFSLTHPISLPSAYGKEGVVTVRLTEAADLQRDLKQVDIRRAYQELRLSFEDPDWSTIRQSVGWAGIQWQALAVSDLEIIADGPVTLSVSVESAASFAIMSEEEFKVYSWGNDDSASTKLTWFNGDMYSYTSEAMTKHDDAPAHILRVNPGRHKVLLRSIYEIRIFGDSMSKAPEARIRIDVRVLGQSTTSSNLTALATVPHAVVPDIVDGVFAGWGLSFALRNASDKFIEVVLISLQGEGSEYLTLNFVDSGYRIAPFQTRPIKAKVQQTDAVPDTLTILRLEVTYRCMHDQVDVQTLQLELHFDHVKVAQTDTRGETSSDPVSYLFTFLDNDSTVQVAAAVLPKKIEAGTLKKRPAILYLHGAVVDVRQRNAQQALLQQNESWIIHPSGRSAWGLDWQTTLSFPLSALKAFATNLYGLNELTKKTAAQIDTDKIMIAGHSNGGQGVLYLSSKHPDLILGAVIGAPYLSLSNYVPLTWQQGRHFNDAAMAGILLSSLSLFDNSLYTCNLAGLPIMLKYGSDDDNVPNWHSKELHTLLRMWNHASGASSDDLLKLSEVPNRGHYWATFMKEDDVQSEFDRKLQLLNNSAYQMPVDLRRFSLCVFNPEDSGSKQGWRITQVETPGRMSRLDVEYMDGSDEIHVRSSHVVEIELHRERTVGLSTEILTIDGSRIQLAEIQHDETAIALRKTTKGWVTARNGSIARPLGPMIRFLSSSGPIRLVLPTQCPMELTEQYVSIALRFATDAYLYNLIDCRLENDDDVVALLQSDTSNVLLLGGPDINSASRLATASQTLFKFIDGSTQFSIRDRIYSQGATLLSMVPHVFSKDIEGTTGRGTQRPMALLLHGTDGPSIERGYSLLPVRTGTLLPEWIVVDKSSMWKGYGGIVASGWFDHHWGWSESMSYLE